MLLLQELVLVGSGSHCRWPSADLRRRSLVLAGDANHWQKLFMQKWARAALALEMGGVVDRLVAPSVERQSQPAILRGRFG